ncbi:MAG: GrpB family protein [Alphaproteobacteria bacterium]|nr:GrpB family protein [Alphaproteobacteria bacterium]
MKSNFQAPSSKPSIEVVPYNERWPELFEQEAALIRQALGENCLIIHHIGSTSVPGLAAKPVIDMIPVVKNILKVNSKALEKLGYTARGELGMLFRRFFYKGEEVRTHHLHIWEEVNPEIDKHLRFRDYLRQNPSEARRYESLKMELAFKYKEDRNSYTMSKSDLINEMVKKAGFDGLVMVQALTPREWAAVKNFRQMSNLDEIEEGNCNYHIVLMKGIDIIGYAHIKLEDNLQASLEMLTIKNECFTTELKHSFLTQLEKWVTHQGAVYLNLLEK